MTGKKTTKKKAPAKKKAVKVTQKRTGQGHNINIKIDQSKRTNTTRREPAPRQQAPQIITTFTPQMAPPPPAYAPMPFYSQPPPQNPFQAAIQSTQAPSIKEEPNELERPKPKEEEIKQKDENAPLELKTPKTKKIKVNSRIEAETMEGQDFDVLTGRTGYKRDNEISNIFSKKNERRERQEMAQEDMQYPKLDDAYLKEQKKLLLAYQKEERKRNKREEGLLNRQPKNKSLLDQPDLSEATWFNPSRSTKTPLEEQAAQQPETISTLTIYGPEKKPVKSGVYTMTDLIAGNERPLRIDEDILRNLRAGREFRAFMGSGHRLREFENNEAQQKRLSEEELRKKRLEKLDKPKPAIFEPKVEKVINPLTQEEKIQEEEPKIEIQQVKPSSLVIFEPKPKPKPKPEKKQYTKIESLKNMSYQEELKQQEEEWKRRDEEQKELRKQYANLFDIDDAERKRRHEERNKEYFFDRNPGKTIADFNEWFRDEEEKRIRQEEKDKIWNRESKERRMMGEHDIPELKRRAKEAELMDESKEGYKSAEVIKREKEFNEYKDRIKKMSYNELKHEAKMQGLKQERGILKQELLNLLLKNRD